ncbi:unnamed protein product [Ectocarpus sp. 4 AP-2014]
MTMSLSCTGSRVLRSSDTWCVGLHYGVSAVAHRQGIIATQLRGGISVVFQTHALIITREKSERRTHAHNEKNSALPPKLQLGREFNFGNDGVCSCKHVKISRHVCFLMNRQL